MLTRTSHSDNSFALGQTPGTRQLEGPGLGEDSGNWQVMTLAVTKGAILGMN